MIKHEKVKLPLKHFISRSCTDIICCLLFLVCLTGMLAVSAVGWHFGDPIKLVYPTNSDGEICGTGTQR